MWQHKLGNPDNKQHSDQTNVSARDETKLFSHWKLDNPMLLFIPELSHCTRVQVQAIPHSKGKDASNV